MRLTVSCTRLALVALAACLSVGSAHAQAAPAASIPPGWVWQGTWQDGRWNGQWVPGPGSAPMMPAGQPMMMPPAPPVAPPMGDHCRNHRHGHDDAMACNGGAAYPVAPQPPMVYPAPAYPPMAYTMVPVMVPQAPQAPCVEKRTVTTTEYVIERHYHTWHPRPHHHDKRVYTGS
jgi:hypothetical protein